MQNNVSADDLTVERLSSMTLRHSVKQAKNRASINGVLGICL